MTKYISMWRLCWKNWLCNRQNVSACAYWVVCSDDCGWSSLQKRATIREHSQQRQLDFNEWCNILTAEVPLDQSQQLSRTETGWRLNRLARLKPNKIKTIFSQTNSLLNKEAQENSKTTIKTINKTPKRNPMRLRDNWRLKLCLLI